MDGATGVGGSGEGVSCENRTTGMPDDDGPAVAARRPRPTWARHPAGGTPCAPILRRPDFRLLFGGLLASMTAESILLLALAIWVKDLTGSDGLAGATIFAVIAPMTLAPLVGWVVDRYPRRPFFVAANLVHRGAAHPAVHGPRPGDVWILYLVAALYGLSYITLGAALSGLIREMVPVELLAEANGVLQTVRQGLRLVGPLAGAALYAALGGWALAAVGMVGFRDRRRGGDRAAGTPQQRAAGRRGCAGRPSWAPACGTWPASRPCGGPCSATGSASLVMGFSESLIFAYVDQGLDRDAAFVGVLVTVQGVGGLLGGLCSPTLVRRLGEVGTLAAGVAFFAPAALALAYPDLRLGFVGGAAGRGLAPADDGGAAHADPAPHPAPAGRPGRRGHPRRWSAARRRSPSGRARCWSGSSTTGCSSRWSGWPRWPPAATSGGAGT